MRKPSICHKPTPAWICRLSAAAALLAAASTASIAQSRIAPADVTRPAGTKAHTAEPAALLALGTKRHGDTSLGTAGRSCNTCHAGADSYNATFKKPWPHFVSSVKAKAGLDKITAEGMVQFCMISAMGARPLPWDSETLAALTAFVLERHNQVVRK
jgi:cytochrome c peroxidase